MKNILFIIVFLGLTVLAFSQDALTLSPEQIDKIEQKVDVFTSNIKRLAGNKLSHEDKIVLYRETLQSFIGEGDPYFEFYAKASGGYDSAWHEAVRMSCINSKYRGKKPTQLPMKVYLSNLIKNSENPTYRYREVVIETSNVILGECKPIGENRYILTGHYVQKFTGYGRDGSRYMDHTKKNISIIIETFDVYEIDGSVTQELIVLLGDIDCDDIW